MPAVKNDYDTKATGVGVAPPKLLLVFFIMDLNDKEIEFLKEIDEAEQRGFPIRFELNDDEKVKLYLSKYGDICEGIYNAHLIEGIIACGTGLTLTQKGREELQKVLLKKEKDLERKTLENEKKKSKIVFILTIIGVILGVIGIYVTIHFSK